MKGFRKKAFSAWICGLIGVGLGLILAGCGGSGGGGSVLPNSGLPLGQCSVTTQAGQVNYRTIWGSASQTASQVIQIIDVDNFVVRSDSINRQGDASSSITIPALQAGVYRFVATMYSGANATGSVVGVAEALIDLCSAQPNPMEVNLTTTNGSTPDKVVVYVDNLTWKQQQVVQYVASVQAGNDPVFVPQNSVVWSVAGGVGTVDSNGLFTATTTGAGSIVATYQSLIGSAAVTVQERVITHSKWTVLVYMNAANDLYSFSDLNVNQMEQVAGNPDVRFVVQWKQTKDQWPSSSFDGVRRYLVKPDTGPQIASELIQANLKQNNGQNLDMGDPQTLNDFITWGKANYPADRYVLILWNHGNGWKRGPDDDLPTRAFSYDDEFGTSIKTWETDQALAGHTVDIIAWDASLMQMQEVAYEARSYAPFIVGSEESPPGEGYPYHLIFDNFRDNPDLPTSDLAKAFVDGMLANPPYVSRKITQSVLDTSLLDELATSLDALALQLLANKATVSVAVINARNTAQSYSSGPTRVYRDIVHLCEILEADATVPLSVKTACVNTRTAVDNAVIWEGHNTNSANSHGLSIDFSSQSTFSALRFDYLQLKFAKDTNWDEWLSDAP